MTATNRARAARGSSLRTKPTAASCYNTSTTRKRVGLTNERRTSQYKHDAQASGSCYQLKVKTRADHG
ncbi:MAG: hypothetical protein ACC628_09475 [Pirellulaceae bacterium]